MLENGTIIADRYEIIGKIGSGGNADVYKAKCHKLNRYVAIKVLKREFSEDHNFINKFRIEAQSAAGMAHANIVNVYDVGDEYGIYYIVMELVEGITLKQYIDKKGALEYKEAISIAIQIAQGIEAAHKHNIIHRDIKPQNIIISKEGKVKVTDFGIAKVTSSETMNSMAMGSVHYISPEQARGGYSDVTSDIYSFGITLFEMCTGRVPFDGESTVAVALMHIQNELMSPVIYNPSIPVSVEQIILKCAQKRMDRRYQSATELITDLKRALITPNEDFVGLNTGVDTSPTVMFSTEDLNNIASKRQTEPELMPFFGSDYPDKDSGVEMIPADSVDLSEVSKVYKKDDYEEHHTIGGSEEDEDDYYDRKDIKDSNKVDKIMVGIGIMIAAVVVIVTIVVVLKVAVTINGINETPTKNQESSSAPAVVKEEGIEVPFLFGFTEAQAQKELHDRGLGYKKITESSDVVAKGFVIAQSVEAGTFVEKNTQIYVTVSTGSKGFEMTDLSGLTEADAVKALEEMQLVAGPTDYQFSKDVEQGKVIKTTPAAKSTVNKGDEVTLVVSRGPSDGTVIMPNILNMEESDARELLDKLGLVPRLSGTTPSSEFKAGRVIAQSYAPEKEVAVGTVIEYVVSAGTGAQLYSGNIVINKAFALADQFPEGFNEAVGRREIGAVLWQSKDGELVSEEILAFTDINSLADNYAVEFKGIVDGVTEGNVEILVRYTWNDPNDGSEKMVTNSVQTIGVQLREASH